MKVTAFGRQLRKLRIDHDMIMKDLADVLGVSSAYVSALELGKKNITEKHINKIIGYFSMNDREIMELRQNADISQPSVKLELNGASDAQRELAVSFARRYQEMNPEEQKKIMKLLER